MLDLAGPATIAVVSDVHANITALRAVVARIGELWIDELIVLGDLLTYGVDVDETLDLIDELTVQFPTTFIRGNHDQIYFDLADGQSDYLDSRPAFVQSAARWTHAQMSVPLSERYGWQWEASRGDAFFSHANPFGPEDWRYLNTDDDMVMAAERLRAMAARIGVFGHTHRPTISRVRGPGDVESAGDEASAELGALVVNPGSVGQPRGGGAEASFVVVSAGGGVNVQIERVPYDVRAHLAKIAKSDLDSDTKTKLTAYFGVR